MLLYFRVKGFLIREQINTVKRYTNVRFAVADLLLGFFSLFYNPYRTCRKFLERRGESEVDLYGETPLRVFDQLMEAAQLSPNDRYVELGSGRGKSCFWAAAHYRCPVLGVDWVPRFVNLSNLIAKVAKIPAQFRRESFFDVDLSDATVVYLYGIHLTDEQFDAMTKCFEKMKKGSRVVTIGQSLTSKQFALSHSVTVHFPWGETEAYIHGF